MFRIFLDKFRQICADERGVAAYLAAAFFFTFLSLAGVAVDVGQLLVAKYQLAAAIDAAALNIAATPGLTPQDAEAQAQAFVDANFTSQSKARLSALSVTQGPTTISITATTTINTALVKVLGYRTLSTTVTNQVAYAQNNLEVALVLDNTGSMSQKAGSTTKIKGLITAATELTNILFGDKIDVALRQNRRRTLCRRGQRWNQLRQRVLDRHRWGGFANAREFGRPQWARAVLPFQPAQEAVLGGMRSATHRAL